MPEISSLEPLKLMFKDEDLISCNRKCASNFKVALEGIESE
jgi:hypothetical protein